MFKFFFIWLLSFHLTLSKMQILSLRSTCSDLDLIAGYDFKCKVNVFECSNFYDKNFISAFYPEIDCKIKISL